jgi:hypothetical protein
VLGDRTAEVEVVIVEEHHTTGWEGAGEDVIRGEEGNTFEWEGEAVECADSVGSPTGPRGHGDVLEPMGERLVDIHLALEEPLHVREPVDLFESVVDDPPP